MAFFSLYMLKCLDMLNIFRIFAIYKETINIINKTYGNKRQ